MQLPGEWTLEEAAAAVEASASVSWSCVLCEEKTRGRGLYVRPDRTQAVVYALCERHCPTDSRTLALVALSLSARWN